MADQDYEIVPLDVGSGGLNDEANPVSPGIAEHQATSVENVDFDRRSVRGSLGARKLHRDLPKLAALRFKPRPLPPSASTVDLDLCPYACIPYHAAQDPGDDAADELQIDFSFRVNADYESITGRDLSATVDGAPPGGEFQFQPLIMRGGDDVCPMAWAIGVSNIGPDGLSTNPAPYDRVLRLTVLWYERSAAPRVKYTAAEYVFSPGIEYHCSVIFGTAGGKFFVNGTEYPTVAPGVLDLPALSAIDRTYEGPIYLAKPITRDTGNYAEAPLIRGHYGIEVTANSTAASQTVVSTRLRLVGVTADDCYDTYFVRVISAANPANEGEIRRIANPVGVAYTDATGTLRIDPLPFPADFTAGDIIDVIPPAEACPNDLTLAEVRLWERKQSDAVIAALVGKQVVRDVRSSEPGQNYGLSVGANMEDLIGYWPLSDDGGGRLEDRSAAGNDGWLSSAPVDVDEDEGNSVLLDGRHLSIQDDVANEEGWAREWQYNLGKNGAYRIHGRADFRIGRDIAETVFTQVTLTGIGNDGDTIYINGETFELDTVAGVAAGNVLVDISASASATDTATALEAALIATFPDLYVGRVGAVVTVGTANAQTTFGVFSLASVDPPTVDLALYETIFDWDDPAGESQDPVLSLRWTTWQGQRQFYWVWQTGSGRVVKSAATGTATTANGLIPHPGRRYSIVFGIQPGTVYPSHQLYVLLLNAGSVPTGSVSSVSVGVEMNAAPSLVDEKKTRISFGASVVADTADNRHHAMLARWYEAGWALRPMIRPGGVGPTPAFDRWTTLDRPRPPFDMEVPIRRDASLAKLERDSDQMQSTTERNWSLELNEPYPGYLVTVGAERRDHKRDGFIEELRPRYLHVDVWSDIRLLGTPLVNRTAVLSEPWDGNDLSAAEVRIVSYLGWTGFEDDLLDPPLQPSPDEGEAWGASDAWLDEGSLGRRSARFWKLGLVPSQPGVTQALFRARWDEGLVTGVEKVRGIQQLKLSDGRRRTVMGLNGSLYDVRPRWVNDHPFIEEGGGDWCFEFQPRSRVATLLEEEDSADGLRESRATLPLPYEGVRLPDGTGGASAYFPTSQGTLPDPTYWFIEAWVKLEELDGRRTIFCRTASQLVDDEVSGPGTGPFVLYEKTNCWFYLENGTPWVVFEDEEAGKRYEISLGSEPPGVGQDGKVKSRELLRPNSWVQIAVQVAVDWGTGAFVDADHAFYINGRKLTDVVVTNTGSMLATDVPNLPSSAWLGVFGNTDTVPGSAIYETPFRDGFGGRLSLFKISVADAPQAAFVPGFPTFPVI